MHRNSLIHELQDLSSMLHAQVVIRCARLQALDSTHVRVIGHKPHELQHLIALVEPPHLMTLELGDWPTHVAPVHGQLDKWLLLDLEAYYNQQTQYLQYSRYRCPGVSSIVMLGFTAIRKRCRLMRLPCCVQERQAGQPALSKSKCTSATVDVGNEKGVPAARQCQGWEETLSCMHLIHLPHLSSAQAGGPTCPVQQARGSLHHMSLSCHFHSDRRKENVKQTELTHAQWLWLHVVCSCAATWIVGKGCMDVYVLNSWCLLVAILLKCSSLDSCPFFGIQGAADADVGKQVRWDSIKGEGRQSRTTSHLCNSIHD